LQPGGRQAVRQGGSKVKEILREPVVLSPRRTGTCTPIRHGLTPTVGRHLQAVAEPLDPFEALGRALRSATTAPDLGSALNAVARCLAAAVDARTVLVAATDASGAAAEAAAGPMTPAEALRLAVHADTASPDNVVIRYIGVSARFGLGAPKGAVLVVVPHDDGRDSAWITEVVQGFAELAELCVVHAQRLEQVERHSDADELTQCLTRRAIERALALELARSDRSGAPFTIAFLDIDGFKRINDEYGHVRGDAVLRSVGNALTRSARATDFVGRYGGDEFLVVMPGTDAEPAAAACARLVAGVAAVGAAHEPELQLSVGIATWGPDKTATELIEQADRAMFSTKRSHETHATAGEQG
jgi:diguanylate cyclase (GGDEF)-like protein